MIQTTKDPYSCRRLLVKVRNKHAKMLSMCGVVFVYSVFLLLQRVNCGSGSHLSTLNEPHYRAERDVYDYDDLFTFDVTVPSNIYRGLSIATMCNVFGCDEPTLEVSDYCNCDEDCDRYGYCCYSVNRTACGGSRDKDCQWPEECVPVENQEGIDIDGLLVIVKAGYPMIGSCPNGITEPTEEGVTLQQLCTQRLPVDFSGTPPTDVELLDLLPVQDNTTGRHYKNIYCASCNGVPLENMIPYEVEGEACDTASSTVSGCFSYRFAVPYGPHKTSRCLYVDPEREVCPESFAQRDPEIAELCRSYAAVITIDDIEYRNVHCAMCHNAVGYKVRYDCPPIFIGAPVSYLTIPFQFGRLSARALSNLKVPKRLSGIRETPSELVTKIHVQSSCLPDDTVTNLEVVIIQTLMNDMVQPDLLTKYLLDVIITGFSLVAKNVAFVLRKEVSEDDIRISVTMSGLNISDTTLKQKLELMAASLTYPVEEGLILRNLSAKYSCSNASIDCVSNRFTFDREDLVFVQLNTTEIVGRLKTAKGHPFLSLEGASTELSLSSNSSDLLKTKVSVCHTSLCENGELVELSSTNFTLRNDSNAKSVVLVSDGKVYEETEYILLPDDRALACHHVDVTGTSELTLRNEKIQYYLNVILSSLSLIALVFTFVTYCVISRLRTLPGKASMNFFVALFWSQFVLLIWGQETGNQAVCTFIAALCHYLWLATFTWMSILAFDVSRTFGSQVIRSRGNPTQTLIKYILLGWGLPIVVLVVCVGLHYAPNMPLRYGSETSCWLSPGYANLAAFGVPVLILLILNVALFVKTIVGVRRTKRDTKKVEDHISKQRRVMEELIIYAKVSSLLGLTWIWGFIAGFSQNVVCWYIYIILNALHGLFIFIFFVCKRRVYDMLRDEFRRRANRDAVNSKTPSTQETRL